MQAVLLGTRANFWERDWLGFLFDPVSLQPVDSDCFIATEPSVILLSDHDGRHAEAVRGVLRQFAEQSTPVCLVHLSDEYLACPIDFYAKCAVVVRNYYRPAAAVLPNALHIPLGYKPGFTVGLERRPVADRKYKWFFAGEMKSSRRHMMAAAQRIPEGLAVTTRCWDDPDGMPTQAYAAALADAVYAPCPRGNDSVDCYRIWEALEAGAIPIVEDDGRFDQLLSFARVPTILQLPLAPRARWNVRYRARFAKSYWFSMFGEEFPLPRIHRWQHLPGIVAANDPAVLSKRVNDWWDGVKQHCRQELRVRLSPLTQHLPHLPAQAAP